MGRGNLLVIDENQPLFVCISCNRSFGAKESLFQHCRSQVHEDEWCERCERLFVSSSALDQHIIDSPDHPWDCSFCGTEWYDAASLIKHEAKFHCWCEDCGVHFGNYRHHRSEYHQCYICDQEFDYTEDLEEVSGNEASQPMQKLTIYFEQHEGTHPEPGKQCYRCTRFFWSDIDIIAHLESDSCTGGISMKTLDSTATKCPTVKIKFHTVPGSTRKYWCYRCWDCGRDFARLSALLQHKESAGCKGMDTARLSKYLAKHLPTV